ncbi:transcriptional activator [Antricoccus suffuscus]|uniref:Transcriptional activator n=1 Tax=Antricoccus suffuscus TaxID=1629062 RepID=A0A2T0ZXH6_9ACTN|nr:AAA family ATPase [Antricoccus suffuscus]PRZ41065.1 transcriptional activator [Antricoccus suffuscus]
MLKVSLLGEQTVVDDVTGTARTRSSRTIALLAFLAYHADTPQSRQHIAGLFWPESSNAQALTNLRRELHKLRNVLGVDSALATTPTDLCWHDTETCVVDIRRFIIERAQALGAAEAADPMGLLTHATAAIEAYRGDMLPGLYDDWLLEARADLERSCIDLCDLVCEVRADSGDLTAAVKAARRRITLAPLEETGYRTLMQLQAELGDRAGAVSTFHRCCSVLERDLGVEPDEATRRTLHDLLSGGQPPRTTRAPITSAVGRSGMAVAQLVGRHREITVLQSAWRAAAAGRPGLALVRGDAGVGKTRLVAELCREARNQGAVVATTQCFGTSGRLALAPVADWLRTPDLRTATANLDPVWRAEVDRLVPSTGDRVEPAVAARAMVDAWQRHRFFEGMARALLGAGRPTLLVLDNLHWCDMTTLALVTFCLGLVHNAPLMVAATVRSGLDGQHELTKWIAGIRAAGLLTELSLGPLEASDTAQLATAISGRSIPAHDADLLQQMTGGFPLYVVEAARTTADLNGAPLPAGDFTSVLRGRLEQVSPVGRDVAGLAAAIGRNFTLALLTEASDLDADTVVGAVDELWQRRILYELRDGYDFSHDLLRECAYLQVSPPKRWLLHRRVAQALESMYADEPDSVCAQLAEQYSRSGHPEKAASYFTRAAGIAAARFAHTEAIRMHRSALSAVLTMPEGNLRDRRELAILEGMAAPLNARFGYASASLQQTLLRTIELAERLHDEGSELTGLIGLWTSQFVQGDISGGHRTVTRVLGLVESTSELSGPAHFAFGGSIMSLGKPAEALVHFELAAQLTRGAASLSVGTRPDVHGKAWSAHAHWLLGHQDAAITSAREAIADARSIKHPYSLAVALAYGAITHQMSGNISELRAAVSELRDLCKRYDFAYYREWGRVLNGWSQEGSSGFTTTQLGIARLKAEGSFARMPYWLSLLADLYERDGNPDAASAVLDAAIIDGYARTDQWWLPEVLRMRSRYDDQTAAIARLRTAAQMARLQGSVALLRRCERDLAERRTRPASSVPPIA